MKIQLIRSAAVIIDYAGKRFLVDPWLGEKDSLPPLPFGPNQDRRNPMTALPIPLADIVNVDAVLVTHLHFDHFDDTAKDAIRKDIPVFTQNEEEAEEMRSFGFTRVEALREEGVSFEGITLLKTHGEHGQGEKVAAVYKEKNISPDVCGVVFRKAGEKTLYLAGDTVWCGAVQDALTQYTPDVVVLNAGHARLADDCPIIMGAEDVYSVGMAAPQAVLVAVHMETVNHAPLTRAELRAFAEEKGFSERLLIPADGEIRSF